MPIVVKEYSWHQTSTKVSIDLPIKTNNVDFFISEDYLKVNASPYIFEAFLPQKIIVESSHGSKTKDSLKLELCKADSELTWDLISKKHLSTEERKIWRERAISWRHDYEAKKSKSKIVADRERERSAAESSMEAYDVTRQKIEEAKSQSKSKFFQEEIINQEILDNLDISSSTTPAYNTILATKVAKEQEKMANLPPVRSSVTVEFEFSERNFPAPKRESNLEDEERWAKKQKEALENISKKSSGGDNIEPNMDPKILLEKGQKFFQLEDYESALEIYNFGIEQVCPNYASVWNNRAAVYLKIGNFHQAIKDATKALELLDPPVDSNALMRAKALIRRGTALCELKCYDKALEEFKVADRILPNNPGILSNIERLNSLLSNDISSSSSASSESETD